MKGEALHQFLPFAEMSMCFPLLVLKNIATCSRGLKQLEGLNQGGGLYVVLEALSLRRSTWVLHSSNRSGTSRLASSSPKCLCQEWPGPKVFLHVSSWYHVGFSLAPLPFFVFALATSRLKTKQLAGN